MAAVGITRDDVDDMTARVSIDLTTDRDERLARYVPNLAAEWDLDTPGSRWRRVDGTMCFVDISGFTNLSEKLARRGRIGAEELTEVLNRVFGEMLQLAYARGGSLLKFGGDALLLLFRGDDHTGQASSAAVEMRAALRKATQIPTSVGRIALRMSVGLHTGQVDVFRVGESHHELVITGEVATVTTEMEGTASANEILISPALKRALHPAAAPTAKGPGWLLKWRKPHADPSGTVARRRVDPGSVAQCVPVALRRYLRDARAESEHRVATIGFIKYKGIGAAMTEHGPNWVADGLHTLISTIQAAADAEDVTFLATDIDEDGGKVILAAGVPTTQEDDEGRMLRAARRILDSDLPFPVRIGVNRGHVFAGEVGTDFRSTYTVMGDTVNLAARLMAAATPGELYASPGALDRSHSLFETTALEPFHVKGKEAPVRAYSVGVDLGPRHERDRRELPFTGREAEIGRLRDALGRLDRGKGGAFTITGNTGMGKSRLVQEALGEAEIPALRVNAEPYGTDNPYWAFRDPIRKWLGIDRMSQTDMAEDLESALAGLGKDLVAAIPLIADVAQIDVPDNPKTASIEPRFRPERIGEAVVRLFEATCPGRLVIVAEDGHWMDDASLALVRKLAAAGLSRPWLVLLTARPGGGLDDTVGDEIALTPLTGDEARSLATAGTKAAPLRPHEYETIVARSGGNPLFLEEILRLVRESGSVDGLPESLDAVAGAEIDALPPLTRRLLRYSSVLGRSFRRDVLDELLAPEDVMLDAATRRELARFIEDDGSDRWRFRHALMHDVAYEGLSFRRRRELHARAGEVIERLAGDDVESVAEFLAVHYSLSGDWEKAWNYSKIAGDKARATYANVEAGRHYERALEAARRLPGLGGDDVSSVWASLGFVREQAGFLDGALDALRRAAKATADDPVRCAELHFQIAFVRLRAGAFPGALREATVGYQHVEDLRDEQAAQWRSRLSSLRALTRSQQGRARQALTLAQDAMAEALVSNAKDALARAYSVMDDSYEALGQPDKAIHEPKALEIHQEQGNLFGVALVTNNLGVKAYGEGRWTEAIERYTRSKEAFHRIGNDSQAGLAAANLGEVLVNLRRFDEAESVLNEARNLLRAHDIIDYAIFAEVQLARLDLERDLPEKAIADLTRLLGEAGEIGHIPVELEVAINLAEAHVKNGEPTVALEVADHAEKRAGDEAAPYKVRLERVRALALAAVGRIDDARAMIARSLSEARRQAIPYEIAQLLEARVQVARTAGEDPSNEDLQEADRLLQGLGVVQPV